MIAGANRIRRPFRCAGLDMRDSPPNMRMQLPRPRGRSLRVGRLSNASVELIRGR